ncbi:MAG: histidine kinase dimerization/phospho-acceptor domain-containing protein [Bdellovibrionota bacterium]
MIPQFPDLSLPPKVLDALFDCSPFAVGVIEMPTLRFLAANQNYCSLLSETVDPQKIIGRPLFEVMPIPSDDALETLHRAHSSGGSVHINAVSSRNLGRQGLSYWSGIVAPLLSYEGKTAVIGLLINVTSQVKAREELELAHKTIERQSEFNRRFVTMVSHELRTPLTALKVATQLTLKRLPHLSPEELQRQLAVLDAQSSKLTSLINDLMGSVERATSREINEK